MIQLLGKRYLDEFFKGEFAIHVFVHLPEDLVRSLLGCRLIFWHLHHRPNLVRIFYSHTLSYKFEFTHFSGFGREKHLKKEKKAFYEMHFCVSAAHKYRTV